MGACKDVMSPRLSHVHYMHDASRRRQLAAYSWLKHSLLRIYLWAFMAQVQSRMKSNSALSY